MHGDSNSGEWQAAQQDLRSGGIGRMAARFKIGQNISRGHPAARYRIRQAA